MRRTLTVLAIAVVAVIAIGVIALFSIDVNRFRPKIEAELTKALHRQVTVGPMSLKLFPVGVNVQGLTISDDPKFRTGSFIKASDVAVSARLFSLIGGSPEISSVILNRPEVELVRNAAGEWNFSSMMANNTSASSDKQSSVSLNLLEINDGSIGYTDALSSAARSVYDHITLKLKDYAPGKQFGLDLDAHLPGSGKQLLSLRSKIGPMLAGNSAATPVDGKISLEEVTLSGLSRFAANSLPPNTDGNVTGNADLSSEKNLISTKGNIKLTDATIKGAKLGFPVESTFDLNSDRNSNLLTIKSADFKFGGTPAQISGTVASKGKVADLNMRVKTSDASISDLAKLAGSLGVAFSPDYQIKGRLTADLLAKGPSSSPEMSGKIQFRDLDVSGGDIKQPVQVPSIDVDLTPKQVATNTFTARSGSTVLQATVKANDYVSANPVLDATIRTDNADLNELGNMAKAYGVEAAKGLTATGRLSLNVHAVGPIHGTNGLKYSGTGSLSKASINAPAALTKPVNISSANLNFSQNSVGVENLALSIGSTNLSGSLSARDLAAPNLSFKLAADKIVTAELDQLTPKGTAAQPAAKSSQPGAASKVTGQGSLAIQTLVANDIVISNLTTQVKLDRGIITLSPFSAELFSGRAGGSATLNTRQTPSTVALNTKLAGVNANSLLSAVSNVKNTLSGNLAANTNLNFALLPGNDLPRTLNGTLSFNLANGELKNVNILNEVSKVAKFLNPGRAASSGNSTALSKLSGSFNFHNGEGNTNDLVAGIEGGSMSAKGLVNLASQALNLDVNAVLSSGTSSAVGGSNVGGFLNTALANNKGELVVPVKVTGTFQHPVVTPDTKAIAEMKVKNLLPTSGNPAAGIAGSLLGGKKAGGAAGIVGGLLGGGQQQQQNNAQQQQQQQQQKPKPEDAVKGLLKGFGHKNQ